jgi:hypothetical protein
MSLRHLWWERLPGQGDLQRQWCLYLSIRYNNQLLAPGSAAKMLRSRNRGLHYLLEGPDSMVRLQPAKQRPREAESGSVFVRPSPAVNEAINSSSGIPSDDLSLKS